MEGCSYSNIIYLLEYINHMLTVYRISLITMRSRNRYWVRAKPTSAVKPRAHMLHTLSLIAMLSRTVNQILGSCQAKFGFK